MPGALETSWRVLRTSDNATATDALMHLAAREDGGANLPCIETILRRRDPRGHEFLLADLPRFEAAILDALGKHSGCLTSTLRDIVLTTRNNLFENAIQIIRKTNDYSLGPTLTTVAVEHQGDLADLAAATVLILADEFRAQDQSTSAARSGNTVNSTIATWLRGLQDAVLRFRSHQRRELAEAFLLLTKYDEKVLQAVLDDPLHSCHRTAVDILTQSTRPRIIRLLLALLLNLPRPSTAAIHILARRADKEFLTALFDATQQRTPTRLRNLVKKVDRLAWVDRDRNAVCDLDDQQQQEAIRLAMYSSVPQHRVFDWLTNLLANGGAGGRRAACQAMDHFRGEAANAVVCEMVRDADPNVSAAAARQLRPRSIPRATAMLIELLSSEHEVVRAAAGQSLAEFSFDRYRAMFDQLDDARRAATGEIVRKVEPEFNEKLESEFSSPARSRRIRAIEMTVANRLCEALEEPLVERMEDEDHFVRAAAAWALGMCHSHESRLVLESALGDPSVAVQLAARESLQKLAVESREVEQLQSIGAGEGGAT